MCRKSSTLRSISATWHERVQGIGAAADGRFIPHDEAAERADGSGASPLIAAGRQTVEESGGSLTTRAERFWSAVASLVSGVPVVIDRPKGSTHPHIATLVYPFDYGYLAGTTSGDGHGIDVWVGSLKTRRVTGAVFTVDLGKRDAEVKILVGCSRSDRQKILSFHDRGNQAAILAEAPPTGARRRKPEVPMKLNAAWHKKNRMPARASLDQRVAWHLAHAKACACRTTLPASILNELRRRGIKPPRKQGA